MIKHFFFDMDGTLTPSRDIISQEMVETLSLLPEGSDITVISGADKVRMRYQLGDLDCILLAQSGTDSPYWKRALSERERVEVARHIKEVTGHFPQYLGENKDDLTQDRGAQISFSFLGHNADMEKKKVFDPMGTLRLAVLKAIPFFSTSLEVRVAGTTCFDYTPKEYTKGKNIARLIEHMGWEKDECIYFGDALFAGGNDETVKGVIETIEVGGPRDLICALKNYVR